MIKSNPIDQFSDWFEMAGKASIDKPNAMMLTTVDERRQPHSRIVLLSSFDDRGFVFHTNYESAKGAHIAGNARVALSFWWDELGYQVHIRGKAEQTPPEASDAYFARRPRGSQLGAWASEQSREIPDRASLEQRLQHFTDQFRDQDVPRPPHWGGYRVIPEEIEFWINGADRLHDRFLFNRDTEGNWQSRRLAP
ncbi:MAG: pyridoxamine 5'-phosphate oxidase [Gammaproteobacteria bacterium]|nr:pyridoxamine 5'-phosphate oxidase [Gammaproteobacteria bacterium]